MKVEKYSILSDEEPTYAQIKAVLADAGKEVRKKNKATHKAFFLNIRKAVKIAMKKQQIENAKV